MFVNLKTYNYFLKVSAYLNYLLLASYKYLQSGYLVVITISEGNCVFLCERTTYLCTFLMMLTDFSMRTHTWFAYWLPTMAVVSLSKSIFRSFHTHQVSPGGGRQQWTGRDVVQRGLLALLEGPNCSQVVAGMDVVRRAVVRRLRLTDQLLKSTRVPIRIKNQ